MVLSAGLLSGKKMMTIIKMASEIAAIVIKMDCQPPSFSIKPPTVGAIIGAIPITSINIENTFADSVSGNISRTMALETTIPAHAPKACKKRNNINCSAECTSKQPNEVSM
ncbi:hypothetical protein D3C72_1044970 [compost metagenome]